MKMTLLKTVLLFKVIHSNQQWKEMLNSFKQFVNTKKLWKTVENMLRALVYLFLWISSMLNVENLNIFCIELWKTLNYNGLYNGYFL